MEAGGRLLGVLLGTAVLAAACASPPARPPRETTAASTPAAPEQKTDDGTDTTPAAATDSPAKPGTGEFVASEELYLKTFREVQDVIAAITKIITAGDYDGWRRYLTEEYIAARSSPAFLADASNAAVLKKNGIVLKSLRDYFDNVVVQSRLQATLDDVQFLDETHVKAIGLVQGTPVILYYLVNECGQWKIGIRGSGDS
jgi:hypothetical protein